jgi:hypothetical protein
MTKEQEQHKAIDEFADKVPEQYKPLFKAFPKETMKLLLTPKEQTLTGLEVKALEKVRAGLPLDQADKILIDKLKQGNPINQLLGDILSDPKIQDQIKKYASQNIESQGKNIEATKQTKFDIKSTDIFKQFKQANPSVSDELLIEEIKKKYPNTIKG